MVAIAFKTEASSIFLMTFLLLFIASHAVGQGAVIWVFIAEIFPNKVRALGQSFGASTHWVCAAIITLITPVFLNKEHGIFGKNPWLWFLPVFCKSGKPIGDGVVWPQKPSKAQSFDPDSSMKDAV